MKNWLKTLAMLIISYIALGIICAFVAFVVINHTEKAEYVRHFISKTAH